MKDYSELSLADFIDSPGKDIYGMAGEFADYAKESKKRKHYNYRRVSVTGAAPVMTIIDRHTGREKEMIYLASNDYLNLTKHPKTIAAGIEALVLSWKRR